MRFGGGNRATEESETVIREWVHDPFRTTAMTGDLYVRIGVQKFLERDKVINVAMGEENKLRGKLFLFQRLTKNRCLIARVNDETSIPPSTPYKITVRRKRPDRDSMNRKRSHLSPFFLRKKRGRFLDEFTTVKFMVSEVLLGRIYG